MAFTYIDPALFMRDHVRLLVRDTVEARSVLSDAEIAALVAVYPNATPTHRDRFKVAYEAATTLYAHWLRQASAQVGPLRIEATARAREALNLVKVYYNLGHGLPPGAQSSSFVRFGGVMTLDPLDRPDPYFTRDSPP